MKQILFLLAFLICGICFSQNPDRFRDGIRTKLVQPDTLSTFDRDALTPKLGTILYHKDTGISRWEEWDGNDWVHFGGSAIPRDSIIMQDTQSIDDIYNYWKGTKAEYYSIVGSDPTFPDDKMLFITDSIPGTGGGTANEFVMADGSFKDFIDDDTFATATSTNIPSAESVKAYVDANVVTIESGTWTPTILGSIVSSYTVQEGRYTVIGNVVNFYVTLGATFSSSGNLSISLPDFDPIQNSTIVNVKVAASSGMTNYKTIWGVIYVASSPQKVQVEYIPEGSYVPSIYPTGTPTNFTISVSGSYITND